MPLGILGRYRAPWSPSTRWVVQTLLVDATDRRRRPEPHIPHKACEATMGALRTAEIPFVADDQSQIVYRLLPLAVVAQPLGVC